jgi:hypothetical protein
VLAEEDARPRDRLREQQFGIAAIRRQRKRSNVSAVSGTNNRTS